MNPRGGEGRLGKEGRGKKGTKGHTSAGGKRENEQKKKGGTHMGRVRESHKEGQKEPVPL